MFFEFLGFAVIVHIVLVSITLGVGLITAVYRYFGYRGNIYAENFSKRAFRIMVVFELFSGVWGTIITVLLAGFFPNLMALAVSALFTPILIALVSIMIRIPSIAVFWYTWGKIDARLHTLVGFVMAFSGFTIPFGFRTIFAELNYPVAIAGGLAYLNPVFWLFYLHTILSAVSLGGFTVASLMNSDGDVRAATIGWKFGFAAFILNFAAGMFYWLFLGEYSQYLFKTITAGIFLPVFSLKIFLVFVLMFLAVRSYFDFYKDIASHSATLLAGIAAAIVALGELINGAARMPYMVVSGDTGLPVEIFQNVFMMIPLYLIGIIAAMLILSIAVFVVALYYGVKRYALN